MWLHRAKIPQIAGDMVRALTQGGDIECDAPNEVQLDIDVVQGAARVQTQLASCSADTRTSQWSPSAELAKVAG